MTLQRKSFTPKPRKALAPMSIKRREKLAELGVKNPTSTFAPKKPQKTVVRQAIRKQWVDTGPDNETVGIVLKRDGWKCACCGDRIYGDRGSEWCIGHRKLRAQGVDNRPANLFTSCMACERETHAGPERARQAGWMLRSTENPEEIPMEHAVHGTVLLINDGTFVVIQAVVAREEFDEHPF